MLPVEKSAISLPVVDEAPTEQEKKSIKSDPAKVDLEKKKSGTICNGKDCPTINVEDATKVKALSVQNGVNLIDKNLKNQDAEWDLEN